MPIPADVISRARSSASGPESNGGTPRGEENGADCDGTGTEGHGDSAQGAERHSHGGRRHQRRRPSPKDPIEDEETVDIRSLANGALVAAVIPGHLPRNAGPSFLVVAGVALSGIGFLPIGGLFQGGEGEVYGPLLTVPDTPDQRVDSGRICEEPPRVLGMRAVVLGFSNLQALALLWMKRPSFQVLDVRRPGAANIVQDISLGRRHRSGSE